MNIVYITSNLKNKKQYIGDHSTDNLNDGYLGSGIGIKNAIEKYGKENFQREILEQCDTKEEAFNAQEKYINEYNTLVPNGYNISPKGGIGISGCHSPETKEKISNTLTGRKLSQETIEKIIKIHKGLHHSNESKIKISNSLKGHIVSKETLKKQSDAQIGKKRPALSKETKEKISRSRMGIKFSNETKEKIRKSRLGKKAPRKKCKYCQKEYADYMYKLYHGDNCKFKDI